MSGYCSTFLQKIPGFSDNERQSIRIVGRKYADYAINRDTVAPTCRALPEHFSVMGRLGTEPELTHRPGVGQFATPRSGIAEGRQVVGQMEDVAASLPRQRAASRSDRDRFRPDRIQLANGTMPLCFRKQKWLAKVGKIMQMYLIETTRVIESGVVCSPAYPTML